MSKNTGDSKGTTPEKVDTYDIKTTVPGITVVHKLENLNDIFEKTDAEIIEYLKPGALPITSLMYARSWAEITSSFSNKKIGVQVEYIGVWLLLHFRPDRRNTFLQHLGITLKSREPFHSFHYLHRWVKENHPELPRLFRNREFTNNMPFDVTTLLEMKDDSQRKKILGLFGLDCDEVMGQKHLCDLIIFLHDRGIKYNVTKIELWRLLEYGAVEINRTTSNFFQKACGVDFRLEKSDHTIRKFCILLDNYHQKCDWEFCKWLFNQEFSCKKMQNSLKQLDRQPNNKQTFLTTLWILLQKTSFQKSANIRGQRLTSDLIIEKKSFGYLDKLHLATLEEVERMLDMVNLDTEELLGITSYTGLTDYLDYLGVSYKRPTLYFQPFWDSFDEIYKPTTRSVRTFVTHLRSTHTDRLREMHRNPNTVSPMSVDVIHNEITTIRTEVCSMLYYGEFVKTGFEGVFYIMKLRKSPVKVSGRDDQLADGAENQSDANKDERKSQTLKDTSGSSAKKESAPKRSTKKKRKQKSEVKTEDKCESQPDEAGGETDDIVRQRLTFSGASGGGPNPPSGPMKNDQRIDCFINSLFKAFIHCEEFAALVVEETPCKGSVDDPQCIGCQFIIKSRHSLAGLTLDPQQVFRPVMMKGGASMRSLVEGGRQQDVHEFMISLFKTCKNSKLHQIFTFQEELQKVCPGGHEPKTERNNSNCFLLNFKAPNPDVKVSVQETLEYNFAMEPVEATLDCGCQISHHSRRIEQTPQVLSFLLVRTVRGGRLNTPVENTFSLQVAGYYYSLHAAIMHDSMEADWGHYYTYVRVEDDWWKMNDTEISLVSVKDMKQDERLTYLLFYRRMESLPPSIEITESKEIDLETTLSTPDIHSPASPSIARHSDIAIGDMISALHTEDIFAPTETIDILQGQTTCDENIPLSQWLSLHDTSACLTAFGALQQLLQTVAASVIYEELRVQRSSVSEILQSLKHSHPKLSVQLDNRWHADNIQALHDGSKTVEDLPEKDCQRLLGRFADRLLKEVPLQHLHSSFNLSKQMLYEPTSVEECRSTLNTVIHNNMLFKQVMLSYITRALQYTPFSELFVYVENNINSSLKNRLYKLKDQRNQLTHTPEKKCFTSAERKEFISTFQQCILNYDFETYYPFNHQTKKEEVSIIYRKDPHLTKLITSYQKLLKFGLKLPEEYRRLLTAKGDLAQMLEQCEKMLQSREHKADS